MAPRVVLLVAAGMTLAGCGDQVVGGFGGDSTSAAAPGSETSDPLGDSGSETSVGSS
ncbi:MAG: hypothetical protein JKY37_32965 [Nannocystaceae bacterium]|nr:hypothetical protein [Nannocystaceae bacterium]